MHQSEGFRVLSSLGEYEYSCFKHLLHVGFCVNMFSFIVGKCLKVELLNAVVNACLTLSETAKLFSKVSVLCYVPISSV